MSVKQPSSAEFRAKYIASLQKDIANQDKNYAANQLFKATATPSAVADPRSITEKTADLEGLKVLLRGELSKITDSSNANRILDILQSDEITFAYQQFGAIEREIKARFRSGVPAEAFIAFLQKYIQQYEETKGVAPTIEESLAPIKSELEAIRRGKAQAGATGEYQSLFPQDEIPDENWTGVGAKEGRSRWTRMKNELDRQYSGEIGLTQGQIDKRAELRRKISTSGKQGSFPLIKDWCSTNEAEWRYFRAILAGEQNVAEGKGIRGGSVAVASSSAKPRGITRRDLVPFGRYFIDACKLEDEIIHLKKPCGSNVPEIPTRKVSKTIGNILKGVVGGKLPSYEDIEPLNDEERNYLHNVVRRAKLNNIVKIPTPDKKAQAAEMDRWELLRGEILAGNDNPELIKEFKVLLLKYIKEGRIPRREANEVLYELMALGL